MWGHRGWGSRPACKNMHSHTWPHVGHSRGQTHQACWHWSLWASVNGQVHNIVCGVETGTCTTQNCQVPAWGWRACSFKHVSASIHGEERGINWIDRKYYQVGCCVEVWYVAIFEFYSYFVLLLISQHSKLLEASCRMMSATTCG